MHNLKIVHIPATLLWEVQSQGCVCVCVCVGYLVVGSLIPGMCVCVCVCVCWRVCRKGIIRRFFCSFLKSPYCDVGSAKRVSYIKPTHAFYHPILCRTCF
ncbi:hypothetical protein ACP275_14G233100 [Erythranthe tilingii]